MLRSWAGLGSDVHQQGALDGLPDAEVGSLVGWWVSVGRQVASEPVWQLVVALL